MLPSVFPPLRCFFCTGDVCLQLFFLRSGHPAPPQSIPPLGYLPPTRSPSSPPLLLLLLLLPGAPARETRMPAAVLPATWTVSHNWHHAIITSHQSNPRLPRLMSDSGPNRPASSHTSVTAGSTRACMHRKKKGSLVGGSRILLFLKTDVAQQRA